MTNIILCGVGGQGTVLASKLIAAAAMARGEAAHTAETIGMAQRGGSVVSHVRIGEGVYSPIIPKGQADLMIAFEPAEAVRNMTYLKPGAAAVVSSAPVMPVTAALSGSSYKPSDMINVLAGAGFDVTVIDGAAIVSELGSAKSLNVALLSAACETGKAGMTSEELVSVLGTSVKKEYLKQNMRAVRLGQSAARVAAD